MHLLHDHEVTHAGSPVAVIPFRTPIREAGDISVPAHCAPSTVLGGDSVTEPWQVGK